MGKNKIFNTSSVKHEVLIAIIGVVVFSMLFLGITQYFTALWLKQDQVIEKSKISLAPIITLATRNINGGNLMNLKNATAMDMYTTNSSLLYVHMTGVSKGTEQTSYMAAIPPKKLEYSYLKEGVDKNLINKVLKKASEATSKEHYLDKSSNMLFLTSELDIPNKGKIVAVFSADELSGVWFDILLAQLIPFLIVLVCSVFIAFYVGRRISTPIVSLSDQITDIAKTLDLTKKVEIEEGNEIHEVAVWFNAMVDSMKEIIGAVSEMTDKLNQSIAEIAASIQEQAGIASQQSSSVSQITSTMEELSATSSQIADNSMSVVKIAKTALQEAEKGGVALDSLNDKMLEIARENDANLKEIIELGGKSKEISKIMEIINSIADQSKLIAFNAAIEASSANEAGKRFSVVAVEIRRLADSVMDSTNDISKKVDEIQGAISRLIVSSEKGSANIKDGTEISKKTLNELINIVSGSKETTEAASQISLSSQQQKTATTQTVTALKEIESGARQSSISIKQTSNVTTELIELAEGLKERVNKFKV
ncbi:MAG: methyl-accepting chemotaxis protein [Nitrospinae bacterium]|nr:methyl-accepting chemotaxis protein [Nitrospinota bacterium]